jgi:hypothetical protein
MKIRITESQYKLLVENDDYNPTNKQLDKDNITIDNLSKEYPQWDFSNAVIRREKNSNNQAYRFLDGLFCNIHKTTNDNIDVSSLLKRGSGCRQCGRDRQIELVKSIANSKIDVKFENEEIERIKDYVRNGGTFIRDYYQDDNYKWLVKKMNRDDTGRFKKVLDDIGKIQDELDDEEIERIKNYVRNEGPFIRDAKVNDDYKWLYYRSRSNKKFQKALDDITKIQDELGVKIVKIEWWGEKTIKNILEGMGFTGVVPQYKYKECKNSLTCRQYKFDIYLPYNKHNIKKNKNIPKTGIIFEYDGIQHFEFRPHFHKTEDKFISQIHRDKEKNLFCKNNNIKLVRIPNTSKTRTDIERDIVSALKDPSTFILTGDYPKAGWNK